MKVMQTLFLSFLLVFTAGYGLGAEKTKVINTDISKIAGYVRIDASRFVMISFDLKKSYFLTEVQVYLRSFSKRSTIRLELMGPGSAKKKKLLSRRNVNAAQSRGSSQIWRPVLTHSMRLDPGTYDIVVSTNDLGLVAELPYSNTGMEAPVRLFQSETTNKVIPANSNWLPMDKKYGVGLIVVGFPLEEDKNP